MANNQSKAAEKTKSSEATWPDLFAGIYDKLTGKGTQISFENFDLFVPSKAGDIDEEHQFRWRMTGSISIRTADDEESAGKHKAEKHKNHTNEE